MHSERGELANGRLSFGGNRPTHVSFDLIARPNLVDGEQIEVVKAIAENGKTYTLSACKVHGLQLYAEYLIESDTAHVEFDRFVVRYREASEWFLHWQKIQGQVGDKLNWERKSLPLSVTVAAGTDQFTLSSEYVGSAEQSGEDLVVHEHIEFLFTTTAQKFSLLDVKTKAHELSCLLSSRP